MASSVLSLAFQQLRSPDALAPLRPAQGLAPGTGRRAMATRALLRVRTDLRDPGTTSSDLTLRIALTGPLASLKRSDVECKILPSRMTLRLGGGAPALEGEFEARVNEQVCFWQFEEAADGLRSLVLVLEKKQGAAHWEYMYDTEVASVEAEVTEEAFLDVTIDGDFAGRITVGLFGRAVPRTVANFVALCTGEKGVGACGKPLHFKGSPFHRCIPGFMVQGGDFERGDGTGGESIYGPSFEDESFAVKHVAPMLLSMANAGPSSNGSQFFITTAPAKHLDGKHVVFGRVLSGEAVVRQVEACGSPSGETDVPVIISDCGRLPSRR